ncbi:MAG: hypothetical protein JNK82_18990 [Myxococcaceae bacterium]|nr:hypothetical protein [Myxococcaceae bacterium]
MTQDPLKAIAFSLHDSLMVLAPPGWTSVELEVVPAASGLKLAGLSTRGDGAKAPRPAPRLGIAKEHEAQRIGEGLDELAHRLSHQGKRWLGGRALCRRGPEHTDLELHDGARVVWLGRLEKAELDQLLITDALLDALWGSERAFDDLQSRLAVGDDPKLLELARYDRQEFVLEWNHAHPDVKRVCAVEHQPAGLSAFWRPGLACDEGFAWALCTHLVVALGARGLVTDGQGARVRLCAVLRPLHG